MATIDDIKELSAYALSDKNYPYCLSPDAPDSPGAEFLIDVRDKVIEAWEAGRLDTDSDGSDVAHEIADNAPDHRTHARWQQFIDLGAYQEEPEFSDEWPNDLTEAAGMALYQIADRLAMRLILELQEGDDEGDDETDETDETDEIPADYPVRPLGPDDAATDRVTCDTCGRSWDDAIATGMTPAPSARCPFESFH